MNLHVSFISVDASKDEIVMTAGIRCEAMPGRWVDFGEVTTSDPEQMQGLHDWYANGETMTDQEFFGNGPEVVSTPTSTPSYSNRARTSPGKNRRGL